MIAGTYTPFTLLALQGAWSWSFTCLVWSVALLGILLRLLHGRLFDRLSLGLYLVLGWIALAAIAPLVDALNTPTLILLAIGGALYTIGVIFHLWERLPFQNVIWHTFVVAAAAVHFAAVTVASRPPIPRSPDRANAIRGDARTWQPRIHFGPYRCRSRQAIG